MRNPKDLPPLTYTRPPPHRGGRIPLDQRTNQVPAVEQEKGTAEHVADPLVALDKRITPSDADGIRSRERGQIDILESLL